MPFDFSNIGEWLNKAQLTKAGNIQGATVPTMFGEGARQLLPTIFPQLLSLYEGRR